LIYSDKFVWLHFPKMAGSAVERIFRSRFRWDRSIVRDRVSPLMVRLRLVEPIWHDSVAERASRQAGFSAAGKTVICGMRRLPDWLYSRHMFEVQRSPNLPHRIDRLIEGRFLEHTGAIGFADDYMRKYLPPEIFASGDVRIIRVEHFRDDFLDAFGNIVDVDRIPARDFFRVRNKTRVSDPQAREIIDSHSCRIYESCPYWAEVEARIYPIEQHANAFRR